MTLPVGQNLGYYKRICFNLGDISWQVESRSKQMSECASRELASVEILVNAYCLVLNGHSYRAPKLGPGSARAKVANGTKAAHS